MSWFIKKGGGRGDPMDSALRTYTVPKDRLVLVEAKPGEIVPCDDPQNVVIVPPKDPEPDLSTKPKDIVGYCFGYVCPKKHVNSTFENITVDGYKERRACQTCGAVAKPAVIRRVAEGLWQDWGSYDFFAKKHVSNWGWRQWYSRNYLWTKSEFVHYLDTPGRRKK